MRILVCGSRDFSDKEQLYRIMDEFIPAIEVVIEGEAAGADRLAKLWAEEREIIVMPFPAKWRQYGNAAGPIRNRQMIEEGDPDMVVAFPSTHLHRTKGTKDMVSQARSYGVPTIVCGAGEITQELNYE